MALFSTTTQPPVGMNPGPQDIIHLYNREGSALSQGQVVLIDVTNTSTEATTSLTHGQTASGTSNCILADAAADDGLPSAKCAFYAVAMEAVADNALGKFCYRGFVQALAGGATAKGDGLQVEGGGTGELITLGTDGVRCIGVACEVGSDGALMWCYFDGINGFGWVFDVA